MNSVLILFFGIFVIYIGYRFYAKRINDTILIPDAKRATPARMFMDGVDFTPANRNVLFGYQFKSIAALGPILGPIVAVQWGWLPALLWIVFGTFFIGWVQDYASIFMGVREEGQSFGALSYRLISPRSRMILIIFIYFYLLLIMGAFGTQVGKVFFTNPAVPLGVLLVILVGVFAGQMTYKWKMDIIFTSIITVVVAFFGIWLSTQAGVKEFFMGLYGTAGGAASPIMFMGITRAQFIGSLLVVVICYFGAVLPIWRWAQPINYVAFWIVLLGIIGGVVGLLLWRPSLGDFPMYTQFTIGAGPLWPILFVTIACGAISGWHSLVSSSGTARQLEKETDALYVGGGAMFLEMFFAIMAFLTATAALGGLAGYQAAGGGGAAGAIFSKGLAAFMNQWGLDRMLGAGFGEAYGSIFLTLMALTIMYLVVRFMRVASAEALGDSIPILKNMHVGTILALILTLFLIWIVPFLSIWVVFGGANQLMASLALLLITLWLMSKGKNYQWTLWPFLFMFVTTIAALGYMGYRSFVLNLRAEVVAASPLPVWQVYTANIVIGLVCIVLIIAALFLAYDALNAFRRFRAAAPAPA
jgi:carbon starvation protein